ncbi:DUF6470 family protein [Aminipila luticellarii]|uniref:Uncharacterized protein n=1 Tax=Aminipila luticellarii TaxID=2507160 RepID=A0A410PSY8_9FIRM|nr:DUF6470 family protein [Aminipila luticellarii]QAT42020.1 hypothetical protein EQM06_01580 [Aminipila luticellarii]
MEPLLDIKTVPICIEFKTRAPQLRLEKATAELEMSTDKGGLQIKSRPIRVNIDTFETKKSAGNGDVFDSVKKYAAEGRKAAYQATARYGQEGNILMDVEPNEEAFQQIADLRLGNNEHQTPNIRWIPDVPPDIQWQPGEMTIKYQMDKINFDFKQQTRPLKFIPGDIEFTVTQKPDVVITYIGGPLYVPPSAEPGYVDEE